MMNDLEVRKISPSNWSCDVGLVILATGFEDRAFEFLDKYEFSAGAKVLIITFEGDVQINDKLQKKYRRKAAAKVPTDATYYIEFIRKDAQKFTTSFFEKLKSIPAGSGNVAIDVSGMPIYMMYIVLDSVRRLNLYDRQYLIYTSSLNYFPSKKEYKALVKAQSDPTAIEYLPKPMALEMAENMVLEEFSGYRNNTSNGCLVLFAGYEAHRSSGVVEATNPNMLLLIYGVPPSDDLKWRQDMSERVHSKFERTLRCAREVVSTQNLGESIDILEQYYNYLIDDYDLTIAPLGSKLQTVASFLFWERYPEVQITFPLPIGYDPSRSPNGVEATYVVDLPARLSFSQ